VARQTVPAADTGRDAPGSTGGRGGRQTPDRAETDSRRRAVRHLPLPGSHGGRRRGLLRAGDEGARSGKPLTVVHLLGDETTADALEADLLACYGVDLLDLYRGRLSFRRVCVLIGHLPQNAAVWRAINPDAGWTRIDYLLAATERRVTALWATIAAALGHKLTDDQLTSPLDALTNQRSTAGPGEPETLSLREIALMMRGG
jgi:hypothetical protein